VAAAGGVDPKASETAVVAVVRTPGLSQTRGRLSWLGSTPRRGASH
jgi:hypothetical protein